jgi:hypothetical protein
MTLDSRLRGNDRMDWIPRSSNLKVIFDRGMAREEPNSGTELLQIKRYRIYL